MSVNSQRSRVPQRAATESNNPGDVHSALLYQGVLPKLLRENALTLH
jgi:hypothetical protein